jgi:hypothetical protein
MGAGFVVRAVNNCAAKAFQVAYRVGYPMRHLKTVDIHRQPAGLAYSTVTAVD